MNSRAALLIMTFLSLNAGADLPGTLPTPRVRQAAPATVELDPLLIQCFQEARLKGWTASESHYICKDLVKIARINLASHAPDRARQAALSKEWLLDCYVGNRRRGQPALKVFTACKEILKQDPRWGQAAPTAAPVVQSADAGVGSAR